LLLDYLVDFVKTLVLETLNPEDRGKLPRHLRKIIQTLLQLLILGLLLDRPDNLLQTITPYQREKTKTRRPVPTRSLHSSRLNRPDTVSSQSLHVAVDDSFLDHVAKVRVQHRLRNHMRLRQAIPGGERVENLQLRLVLSFQPQLVHASRELLEIPFRRNENLPNILFQPVDVGSRRIIFLEEIKNL